MTAGARAPADKSAGVPGCGSPAREPIVLAIDSAGAACSVAIAAGERILAAQRRAMMHGHGEALLPMIDRAMHEARLDAGALDLVATTVGPGGFTGIRVGLAAARGIALASGAELVGITGFEAVAAALAPDEDFRALLVALESRRTDLYIQLFNPQREPIGAPMAAAAESLGEIVARTIGAAPLSLAGDAAARAAAALDRPARRFLRDTAPDAIGVARAVRHRWQPNRPAEPVRPLYLRPPDVTLPARPSHPRPDTGPAPRPVAQREPS